jgi:hypothetical protein
MGFDQRHVSRDLGGQYLTDSKADSVDITIVNRTEYDLPGRFRPARKKHLAHQAPDLLFTEVVRVPGDRLASGRYLGLDRIHFEDVAGKGLFK